MPFPTDEATPPVTNKNFDMSCSPLPYSSRHTTTALRHTARACEISSKGEGLAPVVRD